MYDSPDTQAELLVINAVCLSQPGNAHVIRIYDYWVENDEERRVNRTFIKMEMCSGTLENYLEKLKKNCQLINPLDLFEIMIQISSGLRHCHDCEVCHRDIKPSNGIS